MAEAKEVLEGTGIVDNKEEAIKKDGTKYWKFKIDGKTFSCWEYDMGNSVSKGDKVGLFWTEAPGPGTVVYRNITSIYPQEEVIMNDQSTLTSPKQLATPVKQPIQAQAQVSKPIINTNATTKISGLRGDEHPDRFLLGMAINNGATLLAEILAMCDGLEQQKQILNDASYYENLVKGLFLTSKKLQKELLGN